MNREDLPRDIPDEPGVYRFQKGKRVLYVGKATSLRDRVRSYFSADLAEARSPAIVGMVQEADTITWETTESVLEALILEANTIKKLEPRFNVDEKDNKSFNYLVITKEEYPQLVVVRGRELFSDWQKGSILHLFGPFTSGGALKEAVKLVRKIFPFRDSKCTPESEKPCFNRQIGLCPGVCTGETSARGYAHIIRHITQLFSGKKHALVKQLEKEMRAASKHERFEDASRFRRQIAALTHIRDISLMKNETRISAGGIIVSKSDARIEAFDVAHTSGTETVGVMVVVEGGEMQKDQYRKFKIRDFANNDVGALSETLSRRLLHPEWVYPRVIVVDGSTAQMNAAKRILARAGIQIPIVGVVKDERHRPQRLIGDEKAVLIYKRDILLANSEAHRFAINWHRARRRKTML